MKTEGGGNPARFMAKIRYLQRTHDSSPDDEKDVGDQCAKVLVLLGKAEYITARRAGGRGRKKDNEGTG
jgi:hypothetical protein